MKKITAVLLGLMFVACVPVRTVESEAIDNLVTELNESNGMWINGLASVIDLPPDAEPDEILAKALETVGFAEGHIELYEIQEIRPVQLNTGQMETYSAILIDSDLGTKIFLCRYDESDQWWGRFFDVPTE